MAEKGVHPTSIQDITARAGVATGTFYMHFESKNALVDSLVADINAGLVERVLGVLAEQPLPPARDLQERFVRAVAGYWVENIKAVPLFADYLPRHAHEEILRIGTNPEVVELVAKLLSVAPQVELRATPEFLVATLIAMWRAFGFHVGHLPPEAREKVIVDMCTALSAVLEALAPGLLDVDPNKITDALAAL